MKVVVFCALLAVALAGVARKHRVEHSERVGDVPASDLWNYDDETLVKKADRIVKIREFKQGKEYRFVYDAQLVSGVPQSSRLHSGTRMQCLCKLQFTTQTEVLMELQHCQTCKIQRQIDSPRSMLPMRKCTKVSLVDTLKQQLYLPIKFNYQEGMIKSVQFSEEDKPWSMNVKKGVLNLLQVNLDNANVPRREEDGLSNKKVSDQPHFNPRYDFFTTYEETMEGRCLTSYTFTKQPCTTCKPEESKVLNITKSIDFEGCRSHEQNNIQLRPEISYNFRFGEVCPDNSCEKKYQDEEKFLESSTVYRYNVTGDVRGFVIDQACAESQYVFTPYNEQSNVIVTYTNQTLVLIGSDEISAKMSEPKKPRDNKIDQTIIYTPYWDVKKEEFHMGDNNEFIQEYLYPEVKDRVELAATTLVELVKRIHNTEQTHIDESAPRWLARLVKVFRFLKRDELVKVMTEKALSADGEEKKKIARDMVTDCLGLCGSQPCLEALLKLTLEKHISPIRSALAIKSFVQARVVSQKMIEKDMLPFCEHEISKRSPILRQSCLLTVGSMIGALCKENQDKLAIEYKEQMETKQPSEKKLCPLSLKVTYTQKLMKLFEEATKKDDIYEQILILKTITNAALPTSIVELEKVIRNVEIMYPTLVRAQAIEAYRQLAILNPKPVQRVLMPIYMNQREVPELRMIALYQVLQTLPERPILDQVARKMVNERSRHVASFVTTYMMTLANSSNPCEKRMADDLKLSLRHAMPVPPTLTPYLSRYYHLNSWCNEIRAGVGIDAGIIKSNFSNYMPRDVAVSMHATVWGFWRKYLITLGFAQQDMDQIMYRMINTRFSDWYSKPLPELMQRIQRVAGTKEPAKLLKKMMESLKIEARESRFYTESLNPMAMMYMRFYGQEYGIIPLTVKNIPESLKPLFNEEVLSYRTLVEYLQHKYEFSFYSAAFIREVSRKIPTSVGLPVSLNIKIPTIVALKNVKVQGKIHSLKKMELDLSCRPSMISAVVIKMEVWSPFINHGVKVQAQANLHLPITMKVEYNLDSNVPFLVKWKLPEKEYSHTLVELASEPICFTREWPSEITTYRDMRAEERVIVGEEWNRVKNLDYSVGKEVLGMEFRLVGQVHRTPIRALPGTPYSLLSGPNHVRLVVHKGEQPPQEVIFEVSGNLMSRLESPLSESLIEKYNKEKDFSDEIFETDEDEKLQGFETESQELPVSGKAFKHQIKLVLKAIGGGSPRQVSCLAHYLCTEQSRRCEMKVLLERSPIPGLSSSPAKLLLSATTEMSQMPVTIEDLKSSLHMILKAQATLNSEKLVDIIVKGERSREQQNMLENSRYYRFYQSSEIREKNKAIFSPLSQYDLMVKSSALTKFQIQALYDKTKLIESCPVCLNVTNKLWRLAKYMNYWNTDVDQIFHRETPKSNKILAELRIDPRSYQMVNLTAELPRERVIMTDVPLVTPIYPSVLSMRRRSLNVPELFMDTCLVQGRTQIRTFDGQQYRAPLTTCYSVLAKDCSNVEQPRFSVLKKILDKTTGESKIKVLTEECEIKVVRKEGDKFEVVINGETKTLPEYKRESVSTGGQTCIVESKDRVIKVTVPEVGIMVHFDGYTTEVGLPPIYSNMQCGLCGHYDGDSNEEEEFWTSEMKTSEPMSSFFRSYLYKDENCKLSEEEEKEFDDESIFEDKEYKWEDDMYDSTEVDIARPYVSREVDSAEIPSKESTELFDEEEEDVIKATRCFREEDIDGNHRYCFSEKPVPRCPEDYSRVSSKTYEETVIYHCIVPKSSVRSKIARMFNQCLSERKQFDIKKLKSRYPELKKMEEKEIEETIPTKCVRDF